LLIPNLLQNKEKKTRRINYNKPNCLSKRKRKSAELIIANKELAYQNDEKENQAAELIIAIKNLLTK
jgi:hypothetical protein